MKNKFFTIFILALLMFSLNIHAQKKEVTALPSISVIGKFIGTQSKTEKGFSIGELEFAYQHYLYPDVKADIFTALHKNDKGEQKYEIEESYITFSNFFGTLFPNHLPNVGIGAIIGKKFIPVGKLNQIHSESWNFVDRPLVVKQFFGTDHSLAGEGGLLSYLLPLPFFSQVEVGYWAVAAHEEEAGAGEAHGVEYKNSIVSSRVWNSFSVSDEQEIELGINYLLGNPSSGSDDKQQNVMGVDLGFIQEFNNGQNIKLQTAFFNAKYGEENANHTEKQSGYYVSGIYTISPFYNLGLRYGQLGKHGDEGKEISQVAVSFTRQLTETSKFRIQHNTGDDVEDTTYFQFLFGMGPHSHVLQ